MKEIFEKYDNLTEDELSVKSNKNFYVKNDVMSTVIKRCKGGKKKKKKKKKKRKKKKPKQKKKKKKILI